MIHPRSPCVSKASLSIRPDVAELCQGLRREVRMRYATHATIALIATLSSHAKAEDEKAILPAADFTARQITSALFKAKAGERLD